jgi:type II secretion system protein H
MNVTTMKNKGFSLVEMMVVVVVMAILATIAVPGFNNYMAQRRVSGAANQLFTDFMSARMQAIGQNNNVIVQLTSSTGYTIIRDLNGNGAVDAGETGPAKSISSDYYDVTFTSSTPSTDPVFYPNGTLKPGLGTITVSNSSATKTITISTAGRIKVS